MIDANRPSPFLREQQINVQRSCNNSSRWYHEAQSVPWGFLPSGFEGRPLSRSALLVVIHSSGRGDAGIGTQFAGDKYTAAARP